MYKVFYGVVIFLILTNLNEFSAQNQITIEKIMQGEEYVGFLPEDLQVLPDNSVVFSWKQPDDLYRTKYLFLPKTKQKRTLTPQEQFQLPLEGYTWNSSRSKVYYSNKGNVFEWDLLTKKIKSLVNNTSYCYGVQLSKDEKVVTYIQLDNLYALNLEQGNVTQITNFKKETKKVESAESNYLQKQQEELFEIVRKKKDNLNYQKERSEALKEFSPEPIYIGDAQLRNLQMDPSGKFVTFVKEIPSGATTTLVQNHVTEDGYAVDIKARPKVGRTEDSFTLGVYNTTTRKTSYFDVNDLPNINEIPAFLKAYGTETYTHKGVFFHGPYYNEQGNIAVVECKSLDNKHRWIAQLDFENSKLISVEYQHDEAWIGGPGISGWKEEPGVLGWIKETEKIYFQSEETGYSHLYTYDFKTKKKTALTQGNFEIHGVELDASGTAFYLSANKKHPGNREFYSLDIKSGKWTPILDAEGNFDVSISPDEKQLYFLYSYKNKPTEFYTCANAPKSQWEQLTHSLTTEFKAQFWIEPEVIKVPASDGKEVFARLYQPESTIKSGAAVIFVHGAGYLQNAHNWWSTYFREYMFHNFLVQQGYTVLDMDYRASEGYGRDWRTGIYRHMGGLDLTDQLDGRTYLIEKLGIDSTKIGMYGGSYGGFITLMALLTEPGKFQCGAALRSVTDWAHYNHEYTSNILNTPQEDSFAYRRSSPIYFAENLEDHLIMLHGMVDDNVQFQDVVRLSQRFIELGKDNWELAVFPIEAHGFKQATSWTDEYKRIFGLFEKHLK